MKPMSQQEIDVLILESQATQAGKAVLANPFAGLMPRAAMLSDLARKLIPIQQMQPVPVAVYTPRKCQECGGIYAPGEGHPDNGCKLGIIEDVNES
jgi:hypothetical protein